MNYYIVAGEASGDLHGSTLMRALKRQDNEARFRFWGGDLMIAEGGDLVSHYKERAYMGITEVVKNIGTILGFIKKCKADILATKPDVLILIDYPGFNLKIAKFAREHGIKVHYYISPKVWAWNTKRVEKIKRDVTWLYAILPFEIEFYKKHGFKIDYVGNPLMDGIKAFSPNRNFKKEHGFEKPVIALLPGSRKNEVEHILPVMLSVVDLFPQYQFVIAGNASLAVEQYSSLDPEGKVPVVTGQTYDLISNAEAALVCSGTATLETALLNCPEVVCYKFSAISYMIGKMVVKLDYISLVNLIMNRLVVTELIQNELTTKNLKRELENITSNAVKRKDMLISYAALRIKVGEAGASERVAELIYKRSL
ncbi:MAG: lipid-A-disaccharide synthase [Bacteroidia bacterium]|nr:lipid-A-disaccharide synthase [Bacteroidia bacterium]